MADPAEVKAKLRSAFRDFRVDGVPASGVNEPDKSAIRDPLEELVDIASMATLTKAVPYKEDLAAIPAPKVGDSARVTNDPLGNVSNGNGIYSWTGTAWSWIGPWVDSAVQNEIDGLRADNPVLRVYKDILAEVAIVLDVDGAARVVSSGDGDAKLYGLPVNGASNESLGIQAFYEVAPLKFYPQRIAIVLDVNGSARVSTVQDVSTPQKPSVFGAGLANVGVGAKLSAGAVAGAAAIRTLVGIGVSVFEYGDTVVIEATGTSGPSPTEFLLIYVIGQSNATNEGGLAADATPIPAGIAYDFQRGPDRLEDLSLDTSINRATFQPALAKEVFNRTGLGVIFVNSASGGASMVAAAASSPANTWDVTGTLRGNLTTKATAAKAFLNAGGYCWQNAGVVISQGEQDGLKIGEGVISKGDYKTALGALVDFCAANLGSKLPFMTIRTGYRTADAAGYQDVRAAQMELAAEKPGVAMVYTGTVRFHARALMSDNVHYSQTGKNEIGLKAGPVVTALIAGVN